MSDFLRDNLLQFLRELCTIAEDKGNKAHIACSGKEM